MIFFLKSGRFFTAIYSGPINNKKIYEKKKTKKKGKEKCFILLQPIFIGKQTKLESVINGCNKVKYVIRQTNKII